MIIDAFFALFDIWVLLAMVAGIAIGIVIGAIPGLGPSTAIALLIPVTFSMQPIPALLLLLATGCQSAKDQLAHLNELCATSDLGCHSARYRGIRGARACPQLSAVPCACGENIPHASCPSSC